MKPETKALELYMSSKEISFDCVMEQIKTDSGLRLHMCAYFRNGTNNRAICFLTGNTPDKKSCEVDLVNMKSHIEKELTFLNRWRAK